MSKTELKKKIDAYQKILATDETLRAFMLENWRNERIHEATRRVPKSMLKKRRGLRVQIPPEPEMPQSEVDDMRKVLTKRLQDLEKELASIDE